jgi:hypothetical protein
MTMITHLSARAFSQELSGWRRSVCPRMPVLSFRAGGQRAAEVSGSSSVVRVRPDQGAWNIQAMVVTCHLRLSNRGSHEW